MITFDGDVEFCIRTTASAIDPPKPIRGAKAI
jgi:hypothetical protein